MSTLTVPNRTTRIALRDTAAADSVVRPLTDLETAGFAQFNYFRGRVALAAILDGLGIGPGDEVIVQGFTCEAVPEGVMSTGARPVYADIEPAGLNIDSHSFARQITPRTRAVVVQHTFGLPAHMDCIMHVANDAGIAVIEDCCHHMGSTYAGRPLGSFGVASFYSFEWGKPCVAGLGGVAIINDVELARKVEQQHASYQQPPLAMRLKLELQYRAFGLLYRPALYWPVRNAFHWLAQRGAVEGNFHQDDQNQLISPEFHWRMAPGAARRAQRKAQQLVAIRRHTEAITEIYDANFTSTSLRPVPAPPGSHAYLARYPLLVDDKPRMLARAREQGIELAEWYRTVIHPRSDSGLAALHYEPGSCPQAEACSQQIVSLPTHRRTTVRFAKRTATLLEKVT